MLVLLLAAFALVMACRYGETYGEDVWGRCMGGLYGENVRAICMGGWMGVECDTHLLPGSLEQDEYSVASRCRAVSRCCKHVSTLQQQEKLTACMASMCYASQGKTERIDERAHPDKRFPTPHVAKQPPPPPPPKPTPNHTHPCTKTHPNRQKRARAWAAAPPCTSAHCRRPPQPAAQPACSREGGHDTGAVSHTRAFGRDLRRNIRLQRLRLPF